MLRPGGRSSHPVAECRGVFLPWPVDQEGVEEADRRWKRAFHVRSVRLVEGFKEHSERDGLLVAGYLCDRVVAEGVPLLLRDGHCGERHDLLLLVVEMALRDRVQLVERVREALAGLRRRLSTPSGACL